MNVKLVLLDGFTEKEGQMHELSSNVCTYIFVNCGVNFGFTRRSLRS